MNKNKLALGFLLLFAGLVLDTVLPVVLFRIIAPLSMGSMVGMFATRLIALVVVAIAFVKGGGYILQSANRGKVRVENSKVMMVGGLLIFIIPKLLELLTMISYDLSYLMSGYLVFITRFYIHYILALGMGVLAFFILSKKQSQEEIEEERRMAGEPAPYTKFTYIGSAIVSIPFLIASLLLFEQLYLFPDDYLLPVSFISSNLFWSIAIIGFVFIVFTQGLESYKVVYRDSSGREVGMEKADSSNAFQNEIGALLATFLMPIFTAVVMALVPYFLIYFTIGFFLMNVFTKILLILLILLVCGALFVYSRKNKNRTGEFLWLVYWFFLGLVVLFILYLFL